MQRFVSAGFDLEYRQYFEQCSALSLRSNGLLLRNFQGKKVFVFAPRVFLLRVFFVLRVFSPV